MVYCLLCSKKALRFNLSSAYYFHAKNRFLPAVMKKEENLHQTSLFIKLSSFLLEIISWNCKTVIAFLKFWKFTKVINLINLICFSVYCVQKRHYALNYLQLIIFHTKNIFLPTTMKEKGNLQLHSLSKCLHSCLRK